MLIFGCVHAVSLRTWRSVPFSAICSRPKGQEPRSASHRTFVRRCRHPPTEFPSALHLMTRHCHHQDRAWPTLESQCRRWPLLKKTIHSSLQPSFSQRTWLSIGIHIDEPCPLLLCTQKQDGFAQAGGNAHVGEQSYLTRLLKMSGLHQPDLPNGLVITEEVKALRRLQPEPLTGIALVGPA